MEKDIITGLLAQAVAKQNIDTVKDLIGMGADPDGLIDEALVHKNRELVEYLIAHKAQLDHSWGISGNLYFDKIPGFEDHSGHIRLRVGDGKR